MVITVTLGQLWIVVALIVLALPIVVWAAAWWFRVGAFTVGAVRGLVDGIRSTRRRPAGRE